MFLDWVFWPRVRALVFLGSLTCQTERCAPPPPRSSQLCCSYSSPQIKIYHRLRPPAWKSYLFDRGYEICPLTVRRLSWAERAYLSKVRLKRPSPCPDLLTRVRICKPFKEPRNRFPACWAGTTTHLSYRADWLHRLSESIPRNRFLGLSNVSKYGLSVPDLSTMQGTYPYISQCWNCRNRKFLGLPVPNR